MRHKKTIKLLISIFLFFISPVHASQMPIPTIPIEELSQRPTGALFSILQGSKTLWIGSESGLLGFTGNHVKQFNYDNSPLSSTVNDIIQDKNDALWLITESNGVLRFNPINQSFIQFNQETGLDFNHCFYTTLVGNLLYVACEGGLYSIDTLSNNITERLANSPLYKKYNTAFQEIVSNNRGELILVGADQNIYKYVPNTNSIKKIDLGTVELGYITALFCDSNNVIWLSTENGEYKLDFSDNRYDISKVETDIPHNGFIKIFEDSLGDIWFIRNILLKLDKKSNKLVSAPALPSILSKALNDRDGFVDITEGINGELYILSPTLGVIVLSKVRDAVSYLSNSKREYLEKMQRLEKLPDRSFLFNIYSASELVHYNTNTRDVKTVIKEQYNLYDLQLISDSEVLFVEAEKGLHLLDLDNFNIQQITPSSIMLPDTKQSTLSTVNIDNEGELYISVYGPSNGIYKGNLDTGFEISYPDVNVLSSLEGSEGNLFFATYLNGVIEYTKNKKWRQWTAPENIGRPPYTRCMTQDKYKVVWLCQSRNGLAYLDDKSQSIKYINRRYTANSDAIRTIVSDQQGYLWVATSQGLVRYDHQNKTSITLGKEHGIFDTDFYFTATQLIDEKILIIGDNANYVIDTSLTNKYLNERLKRTTEVQLMDVQLSHRNRNSKLGRKVELEKSLQTEQAFKLTYDEFLFTLEFAINDFTERDQFTFEYRLLGLNEQWTRVSRGEDSVTYTTLPSGSYTFEIRTIDARSIAEQPITRLPIKVLPPYWLTTQAYLLYTFLILILFYSLYRYRTRQLTQTNIQLEKAVVTRTKELTERSKELESKTIELSQSHTQISNLLAQKESLFANVSHEFRTPLTLILGPMSQLRSKLADDGDIQQFDMMQRNTKRLVQLVEQILELARLDTAVESPKQIYAIDSALGILVNSFKPLAELKSQDIVFTNHCSGGLELTADALEKILYNLLSNAIKYSPDGGTITVTGEQTNNQYQLSIQDTGYGIPEEELETIFERFTRLEKTSEQLGSGLGLAVVKELVQANEGTIEVESELNKGTTFTVTFPLLSDFDENEATPLSDKLLALESASELVTQTVNSSLMLDADSKPQETNKPVLLIIEDNQDMQAYIKQSLDTDYECMTANNGQQGIDMAVEHIPDMILSDLMMPLKGGFEVVDHLRNNELTAHIPITLLTAKGDDNSRLTGWQKTVDDYIAKPFNVEELKLRLSRLLSVRDIVKKRVTQQLNLQGSQEDEIANEDERPTLTFNCKRDEQFYNKLMQVIEDNYTDSEFGRPQAADALAVSERQLNRKLSAIVEYNFAELVRKYRLEKAKELLLEGYQIGEVAYDIGFTSPSYFSRCFKAEFGILPKQFCTI